MNYLGNLLEVLRSFAAKPLADAARDLLATLGYRGEGIAALDPNTADEFRATFDPADRLNPDKALIDRWRSVDLICQVTDITIGAELLHQPALFSDPLAAGSGAGWQSSNIYSYLFFAIDLEPAPYTRTQLAAATREINKLFLMPAMVIFRHGDSLTFAIIARRRHKRDADKDVLEKVTLIRGIRFAQPHRAHLDILADLSLAKLAGEREVASFTGLQAAWETALDTAELNKRFYKDIANWYFWATGKVTFPAPAADGADEDAAARETRNATNVIRLITRLIFVWFLKEKGLVPDLLFDRSKLRDVLTWDDPKGSTYYKAILQNLFFATLNTQRDRDEKDPARRRRFRRLDEHSRSPHYGVHNLYRYERLFRDPQAALALFADIPFLNGGLFECLDRVEKGETPVRIDGFSDRDDNPLAVPDELFFQEKQPVDLNKAYNTSGKQYEVRGLLRILERYKFTVEENTPIEEEVALDPELLGRVFENLLAAYNPETQATARKLTGSYYTPRMIVDYMVDESLLAYFAHELAPAGAERVDDALHEGLRSLIDYGVEGHSLSAGEAQQVITAIDNLKILDPACGSGAFPMGILHKLVFILGKVDPHNERWKRRQIERARGIEDSELRSSTMAQIEQVFANNYNDYGRKLYLIENSIYGVDIQPIAVQIAKLRFFISLVVDQKINDELDNRGIRALPNLETKFVAATTLVGIDRPTQLVFRNPEIERIEQELAEVRREHFGARSRSKKEEYRARDKRLRTELIALLEQEHWPPETAAQLAAWDPYDQSKHSPFFDPEWMFSVTDGFDITIGNPPYVRADASEAHVKFRKQLEAGKRYETLWEKWDLFIPFIEIGYQLLSPGGVTTMIVSDAYCHAKYAQRSQNWFLENSRILRLDFLSKIKVFEAGVHNIIYFYQKLDGTDNVPERREHEPQFGDVRLLPSAPQDELTYRVFFPGASKSANHSAATLTLEEICYITVGMVVHADEREAKGSFRMEDVVSDSRDDLHSKPFVEGKHLGKWLPLTNRWLEWGTARAPQLFRRPTFPQLYEVAEKVLVQRSPGPDPKACYDNQHLYFNESSVGFILWHHLSGVRNNSLKKVARYGDEKKREDLPRREALEQTSKRFALKYLLAVMNSRPALDFLRANRRSNIHLYPEDWKALPIPDVPREKQQPLIALVSQILAAKAQDPAADVRASEAEIDRLVYALYGLTD